MLPIKSDDVNATVLPDGRWLLYDRIEHVALTLAAPAGILWELCDGQSSHRITDYRVAGIVS